MPEQRDSSRRVFVTAAASAVGFAALVRTPLVRANEYPNKPIRAIIPFPPGGSTDTVGRMVCQALSERIGQSVVVENRPGAGAMIGAQAVSRAPADGYTVLFAPGTIAQTPVLNPVIEFDPSKELAALSMCTEAPLIIVANPECPAASMAELLDLIRQKPGLIPVGYPGLGTTNHLALEMLKSALHIDVNGIPYPGNAEVATAILRGEIMVAIDSVSSMRQYVATERVRALSTTGLWRSSVMPELATVDETVLPGFMMTTWTGMFAPAGTPPSVVRYLSNEIDAAVQTAALASRFRDMGFEPIGEGSEMIAQRVSSDLERTRRFIRETGFSLG